ncbi:unnamed protein product [Staurois parvus]|uniref:Uncharacterized protein n=1 Tax=Staurois parvus TaxID=386267 RepID=A0ABN9GM70_9NEOB|nr:unnamed protein product [Staurois parvus]
MGPCTASPCCCQARNLPWAPRTDSSCCCQARNLPWAPVPPPHAAARSRVCHGSLYGLPLLLSLYRHTLPMCHFSGLLTLLVVSIFVIGCCMAIPLLLPPPPHCGSTLWFWPCDCPNE